MLDLTESIAPKSDQMNADDLMSGPRTFTISEVRRGASAEQPFDFYLAEFHDDRPFKPSKSMRRVMVSAWGKDGSTYVGKRLTLYRDPAIKFGGQEVGGIRISHMSGIEKPMKLALTSTRGKRDPYVVQPLPDEPSTPDYLTDAQNAQSLDEWRKVWQRAKDAGHLTPALKAKLTPLGEALKESDTSSPAPVESAPGSDPVLPTSEDADR